MSALENSSLDVMETKPLLIFGWFFFFAFEEVFDALHLFTGIGRLIFHVHMDVLWSFAQECAREAAQHTMCELTSGHTLMGSGPQDLRLWGIRSHPDMEGWPKVHQWDQEQI